MKHQRISWEGYEYEHKDRSVDWYWAVGVIAIALAITAIIYKNILFAIFIILGAFTLLMYAARKPEKVYFEISRRGVRVNKTLYPFSTLESFCIHDNSHSPKIIFQSQKLFMPHIIIPLSEEIDVESLHNFLIEFIDEDEHRESISEMIMDYLGF